MKEETPMEVMTEPAKPIDRGDLLCECAWCGGVFQYEELETHACKGQNEKQVKMTTIHVLGVERGILSPRRVLSDRTATVGKAQRA